MNCENIKYHCLICASNCSSVSKVDKSDVIFLLRLLLQIPQDSYLIYTIKSKLSSVKICDQCTTSIKQCRQLYTEINKRIEIFWGTQNKILGKISSSNSPTNKIKRNDPEIICEGDEDDDDQSSYNNWVDQCRKFVKDHHFGGFGYPFVVQDLDTLFTSLPPTQSSIPTKRLTVNLTRVVKNEVPVNFEEDKDDEVNYDDDLIQEGSPPSISEKISDTTTDDLRVKVEPDDEDGNDNDNFVEDEDYSSEKSEEDDDSANNDSGSDNNYEPPSKKTRSSVVSKPTIKNAKGKDKPIIKTNYQNRIKWWTKFKKDPETGKFICEWPDCDKQFSSGSSAAFKAHQDMHRGTPNQNCDQCDLKFYKRTQLVQHREAIHGTKEFKCEICGKSFGNSVRLHSHRRDVHLGRGQQVVCDLCGRTMKKSYLRLHMRRSHLENMRKYCCEKCPATYEQDMELKMHLWRAHEFVEREEEKEAILGRIEKRRESARGSFKCHVRRCRMSYVTKERLERHVDEKHGGNWERREDEEGVDFKCEICGRGYHDRRRFNEHRKHHENVEKGVFRCGECGRCCPSRDSFERHKGTHGKDKRWACEVCGKGFGEEKSLRRHEGSGRHKKRVEETGG